MVGGGEDAGGGARGAGAAVLLDPRPKARRYDNHASVHAELCNEDCCRVCDLTTAHAYGVMQCSLLSEFP